MELHFNFTNKPSNNITTLVKRFLPDIKLSIKRHIAVIKLNIKSYCTRENEDFCSDQVKEPDSNNTSENVNK